MDIESIRLFCLEKAATTESFPFDEQTLVFKVAGKMFALTSLSREPLQINLKCDPDKAVLLREDYPGQIIEGYHMNKKHWNTILLDEMDGKLLTELINHSYDLVVKSLTKKVKLEHGFI